MRIIRNTGTKRGLWDEMGQTPQPSSRIRSGFVPAKATKTTGYVAGTKGTKRDENSPVRRDERDESPRDSSLSSRTPVPPKLSTGAIDSTHSVSGLLAVDPGALAWAHAMRGPHPLLAGSSFTRAESETGRRGHEDWHVIADRVIEQWWRFRGRKW